jgi:tetratricopeptide (TPR) repeat protein
MWEFQLIGEMQRSDSIGRVVDRRGRLSPYYQATLDFTRAWIVSDLEGALRGAREMVRVSPRSQDALWSLQTVLRAMNRPREATEIWKQIGFDKGLYADNPDGFIQYASVLHHGGDDAAAIQIAREVRRRYPAELTTLWSEIHPLAGLGRVNDVMANLDTMVALIPESQRWSSILLRTVPQELRAHGHDSASRRAFRILLSEREKFPPATSPGAMDSDRSFYYIAAEWERVSPLAIALAKQRPESLVDQAYLGLLAARRGDRAEAERISLRLNGMRQRFRPGPGNASYWRARIAAILGDKETAVRLLKEAFDRGFAYDYTPALHFRVDFDSLRGYPPFEALMAPKG